MSNQFSSRVTTAPGVMMRIIRDEAVILNLKSEVYLGLNSTGTRMWTVLHEAPSIQDAYESLLGEYEVAPERLRQELDELLDRLLAQGLIELTPAEAVAQLEPLRPGNR
jgi:Coenzyme PQQ synthesis protein D (PqqD)